MTKIIGLTGGIGSGKTTIANYFKSKGIPVYIADDEAKNILQTKEVQLEIRTVFGNTVFSDDKVDKNKLAEFVFSNPEKLKILNSIIHPKVKNHFDNWVEKQQNFPFVIKEAAILFESGSYKLCDKIITIVVPLDERIQRVIHRDTTSYENVMRRINNQWTDEQRMSKSDYIIYNSDLEIAKKQANSILKILKNQ
ncbi:dephospho-CoA kinase [Flavobacterium dankookense]|uniref:Dephospho-CoA kinase n=1 Tax=Flavobacterium dankookense TaxID=706186 RepID=A0A4R6Q7D6_9FLAO|nr:dephospho-CoA kinase [Flavobacterium dankookense]TDP57533.1 dephospho-CoA kinase [Flavobacterium dankookense]